MSVWCFQPRAKLLLKKKIYGERELKYNFLQLSLFFESYFKAIKYMIINFIYSAIASITVLLI